MLEWIRVYLTKRHYQKIDKLKKTDEAFGSKIRKRLEMYSEKSASYSCLHAGGPEFQVTTPDNDQVVVNLELKTCPCKKWQLTGIPCPHAIRAIFDNELDVDAYVDEYYNKESYMAAYAPVIHPTNGKRFWKKVGESPLQPPHYTIPIGRPKGSRNKKNGDAPRKRNKNGALKACRKSGRGVNHCGECNRQGHSVRTCPDLRDVTNAQDGGEYVIPRKPKKMGRPKRKNTETENVNQNATVDIQPQRRGRKPNQNSFCKFCKKTCHYASICQDLLKRKQLAEERAALRPWECTYCHKPGHKEDSCPILAQDEDEIH